MGSAPGQLPGGPDEPHLPARCPPPAPGRLFPGVGTKTRAWRGDLGTLGSRALPSADCSSTGPCGLSKSARCAGALKPQRRLSPRRSVVLPLE